MSGAGIFDTLQVQVGELVGEPVEVGLLVHRSDDQPGAKGAGRLLRKGPGIKMRTNNYLCLTPSALHLIALGGRSGVKVKEPLAAWDRRTVTVEAGTANRSSWMASTGSHYTYGVHTLRISGPELTLVVDVMADNALDDPAPHIDVLLAAAGPTVPR